MLIPNQALRRNLLLALFLFAGFVRLVPSLYNVQSNDDHLEVMHRMNQGLSTRVGDCWQCYHPKLYHQMGRTLLNLTGTTNPGDQFRYLNLLNSALGLLGLALVWKILGLGGIAWWPRYLVLALLAFNGLIVRTHTMATNETLVGVFALAAFWQLTRLWRLRTPWAGSWALIFCILAVLTKGSGLVVSLAVLLGLLAFLFVHRKVPALRNPVLWSLLAFCLLLPTSMASLGSYKDNFEDRGSILSVNSPTVEFPHLWKPSLEEKAGVISLSHFLLRLELWDLLEHPFLIHGLHREYPSHRANFWATVYAEFWYSRYPWFPGSNVATDPHMIAMSRFFYLSGLLPTMVLVLGWWLLSYKLVRRTWLNPKKPLQVLLYWRQWLPWMIATGFLTMLLKFSFDYRAYNFVKTMYMLPGIIGFAWLCAKGLTWLLHKLQNKQRLLWMVQALWWVAIAASALDSLYLGRDYALNRSQMNTWNERYQVREQIPPDALALESLPWDNANQNWGAPKINMNALEHPLRVDGRRFWRGLGVHANSEIRFSIPQGFSTFYTRYGLCDSGSGSTGVRFVVEVDGKVVHRSSILTWRRLGEAKLSIHGAQSLVLRVEAVGAIDSDHACWLEPTLLP